MRSKRLLAYLIDLMILGVFVTLVLTVFPENTEKIVKSINQLNQMIIEKEISLNAYIDSYKILNYNYDKATLFTTFLNIAFTVIFYMVVPYFMNGQTLGMKLTKIKIQKENDEKPTLLDLFNRTLIMNFMGYMILSLLAILILSKNLYFYVSGFLILLSYSLVIISIFMVLYRQDRKGLQDILTKTKIIRK